MVPAFNGIIRGDTPLRQQVKQSHLPGDEHALKQHEVITVCCAYLMGVSEQAAEGEELLPVG